MKRHSLSRNPRIFFTTPIRPLRVHLPRKGEGSRAPHFFQHIIHLRQRYPVLALRPLAMRVDLLRQRSITCWRVYCFKKPKL